MTSLANYNTAWTWWSHILKKQDLSRSTINSHSIRLGDSDRDPSIQRTRRNRHGIQPSAVKGSRYSPVGAFGLCIEEPWRQKEDQPKSNSEKSGIVPRKTEGGVKLASPYDTLGNCVQGTRNISSRANLERTRSGWAWCEDVKDGVTGWRSCHSPLWIYS